MKCGQVGDATREVVIMEAPIFIGELEITEPINGIVFPVRKDGPAYQGARLLVRMQHLPLGYVFLSSDTLDASAISRKVWLELGRTINSVRSRAGLLSLDTLSTDGIPVEESLTDDAEDCPFVTVVLCTRNRPRSVMVTLRGLASMQYGSFEIVVVDNAPSSDATRDAILQEFSDDPRIRYVRELRRGTSCARNRGIKEARADIIAFTDDDVKVDPWWLDGIMNGFRAAPDAACVTGLIATAEIENAAQLFFDLRAGWANVREGRIFDLTDNRGESPLYPYAAGGLGAGANCAVSRKVLDELGGFDEALGPGTPSGGGEDLDIFIRVILSGNLLVHEPSAIVSHYHRSDLSELKKQMRTYGSGTTAAIAAILMKDVRARREVPAKVLGGIIHVLALRKRVNNNDTLPSGLMAREMWGMLTGPWLYLKGRYKLRRLSDRSMP
jgi:glycosyltransferase involved in cell wall biosynthesis